MKKTRKNENHPNSFDNSIKNHINVPETWNKVLWSDLEPLQPGNKCLAIKLTQISPRDILWLDINDYWSENHGVS